MYIANTTKSEKGENQRRFYCNVSCVSDKAVGRAMPTASNQGRARI
jgi:hypothetical protein